MIVCDGCRKQLAGGHEVTQVGLFTKDGRANGTPVKVHLCKDCTEDFRAEVVKAVQKFRTDKVKQAIDSRVGDIKTMLEEDKQ